MRSGTIRWNYHEYEGVNRLTADRKALKILAEYGPETEQDVRDLVEWVIVQRGLTRVPYTAHSRKRNCCYYAAGEHPKKYRGQHGDRTGPVIRWLTNPRRMNYEMVAHEVAHHLAFVTHGLEAFRDNPHGRQFVDLLDDVAALIISDYPNLDGRNVAASEALVAPMAASRAPSQGTLW
ncbi:MAG: hypothetical protein DRJ50_09035 [Actinobacteria bacterium]|nr:MAG: hypothetical protein DRJ50_09035 [Actinomycetota bacterium]